MKDEEAIRAEVIEALKSLTKEELRELIMLYKEHKAKTK